MEKGKNSYWKQIRDHHRDFSYVGVDLFYFSDDSKFQRDYVN